jgi:hypothetical protein
MASRTARTIRARGRATYTRRQTTRAPLPRGRATPLASPNHSVRHYQRQPRATLRTLQPETAQTSTALLVLSHQHAEVIATTIQSAITSGQEQGSIFVLDRHSTDHTRQRAAALLGPGRVVSRSGSTIGDIQRAVEHFNLTSRYQWVFIAEADTAFSPDYFRLFQRRLRPRRHVVARGSIKTLHGNWLGTYQDLAAALTTSLGSALQLPPSYARTMRNPVIGLRTDALQRLQPDGAISDFNTYLQLIRSRSGKALTLRRAVSFVPQPGKLRDFCRQTLQQQRDFFQSIRRYQVGRRPRAIDLAVDYRLLQTIALLMTVGLLLPLAISRLHTWLVIPAVIAADFLLNILLLLSICLRRRNRRLFSALTYFYVLRWIELGLYLWAFMEVMAFDRYQTPAPTVEDLTHKLKTAATSPSR